MSLSLDSPDDAARAIGQRLRSHRLAQNCTQRDLAARAGIAVATLKRIEAAGAGSITHLLLIAWTLGLQDAFIDLIPAPAPGSIDEIVTPVRRVRARPPRRPA